MNRKGCYNAVLLVSFLLVLALVFSACGSAGSSSSAKPQIKLVSNTWEASEINAAVAKILLEEKMGFPVEIIQLDEFAQWEALASGEAHASLEVWRSGHTGNIQRYIEEEATVVDGGLLGPVGKISWYIPSYLLRDHPDLATWMGFTKPDNVALFANENSGGKGRFLTGDPSWSQYDRDLIKNLSLDLEVVVMGSEEALLEELASAYQQKQPILFYFWTPHWVHVLYDLSPVALPSYNDGCYKYATEGGVDCDYPTDQLMKIFWSGLEEYSPTAYQFLQNFKYTNTDQISMLATVKLEGKSITEAAQMWVDENENVWKAWIP